MMRFGCSGNEGEDEFNLNDYMHSPMAAYVRLGDLI